MVYIFRRYVFFYFPLLPLLFFKLLFLASIAFFSDSDSDSDSYSNSNSLLLPFDSYYLHLTAAGQLLFILLLSAFRPPYQLLHRHFSCYQVTLPTRQTHIHFHFQLLVSSSSSIQSLRRLAIFSSLASSCPFDYSSNGTPNPLHHPPYQPPPQSRPRHLQIHSPLQVLCMPPQLRPHRDPELPLAVLSPGATPGHASVRGSELLGCRKCD